MFDHDFKEVARHVLGYELPAHQQDHHGPLPWLPRPASLNSLETVAAKPVEFAIEGLLLRRRAHLLTGVGGSSKSTLLTQLAVGIASNKSVLGWNIGHGGHAVLLLAEDTEEDAQRLVHNILVSLDLTPEERRACCSRLHVFAAAGVDCTLIGHPDPEEENRVDQLIAYCQQLGNVSFIGLDPAIALTRGRELDELDQRQLATTVERLALKTGAAVVLVSHAAKSVQYQTELGSHHSRGSGALTDALRLEMLLRTMTTKEARSFGIPDTERQRFVRFQVTKANRLPPEAMKPRWFMRGEAGILTPAALEIPLEAGGSLKPKELCALEAFLEFDETTGEITPVNRKFADWKSRCAEHHLLTGNTGPAQDMSARRLLQSLQQNKLVAQKPNSCWALTPEGMALVQKGS